MGFESFVPSSENQESVDELTPEGVKKALEEGRRIQVKVQRSSGEMEDDWEIWGFVGGADVLRVGNKDLDNPISKEVPFSVLREWNGLEARGNIEAENKEMDKLEQSREKVLAVNSFDELYRTLDELGGLQGSQSFYSADKLKSLIDGVRSGREVLGRITNTASLRPKVQELLEAEKGISA